MFFLLKCYTNKSFTWHLIWSAFDSSAIPFRLMTWVRGFYIAVALIIGLSNFHKSKRHWRVLNSMFCLVSESLLNYLLYPFSCPTSLVPYVLSCLMCLVRHELSCFLTRLFPHVLCALRAPSTCVNLTSFCSRFPVLHVTFSYSIQLVRFFGKFTTV